MTIGRGFVRSVALALALAPAQAADVKVTQGPPREKFLHSPMLLEMPLEVSEATSAGVWVNVDELRRLHRPQAGSLEPWRVRPPCGGTPGRRPRGSSRA